MTKDMAVIAVLALAFLPFVILMDRYLNKRADKKKAAAIRREAKLNRLREVGEQRVS